MENQVDRRKRNGKFMSKLTPGQNQNFSRKDNSEDYQDVSAKKFKPTNQYHQYRKDRGREMSGQMNSFNFRSSNKKEVQNVSNNASKEICPWSDEASEEERQRQVKCTADRIKMKLKMWNELKDEKLQGGENIDNEKKNTVQCNDTKALPKQNSEHKDNELINMNNESIVQRTGQSHIKDNNTEGKNFHISGQEMSHQNSTSNRDLPITQTITRKPRPPPKAKPIDFYTIPRRGEKRAHKSLISELMSMPKAQLKEVLANPQINPRLERKIAQLVKESRLMLAQSFHTLAESKMKEKEESVRSKFVNDVEDLIDPDLAVDLCQLPPELITQIGNIFQLNFDGCMKASEVQENSCSDKNVSENFNAENALNCDVKSNLNQNAKDGISHIKVKEISDNTLKPQMLNIAGCNDLVQDKVRQSWYKPPSPENFKNTFNVTCTETNPRLLSLSSSCMVSTNEDVSSNDCLNIPAESNRFTSRERFSTTCETFSSHGNNRDIVSDLPVTMDECSYLAKHIKIEPEETVEPNSTNENSFNKFVDMSTVGNTRFPDEFVGMNMFGNTWTEQSGSNPEGMILNLTRDIAQPKIFDVNKCATEKTTKDKCDNNIQSIKEVVFENKNENPVYKSTESQTDINLIEADHSQPFMGHIYSEGKEESLLREVQMIDELIHRLNQRRFILFLKLVGLESCSLNRNNLKTSLMQTITNSDAELMKELSLGGNYQGKRKWNPTKNKNMSQGYGMRNNNAVNAMNHTPASNIEDLAQNNRKCGGKPGYWKNHGECA